MCCASPAASCHRGRSPARVPAAPRRLPPRAGAPALPLRRTARPARHRLGRRAGYAGNRRGAGRSPAPYPRTARHGRAAAQSPATGATAGAPAAEEPRRADAARTRSGAGTGRRDARCESRPRRHLSQRPSRAQPTPRWSTTAGPGLGICLLRRPLYDLAVCASERGEGAATALLETYLGRPADTGEARRFAAQRLTYAAIALAWHARYTPDSPAIDTAGEQLRHLAATAGAAAC
jgi:hypothetical protein